MRKRSFTIVVNLETEADIGVDLEDEENEVYEAIKRNLEDFEHVAYVSLEGPATEWSE